MQVTDITPIADASDDWEPPPYGVPGRMLIHIDSVSCEPAPIFRYSAELIDYDPHSSVFWLLEGIGIEYFLDSYVDLEDPGYYVFEGVVGEYYRGDGWTTDDDEEWRYALCRRASAEEIEMEALS